jgi:hypothetical protein
LLILRLAVAGKLVSSCSLMGSPLWVLVAALLVAMGLSAGFHARLLSGLCLVAQAGELVGGVSGPSVLLPAMGSAAALALIGPGALSVDAKLFGHRTVTLADSTDTIV